MSNAPLSILMAARLGRLAQRVSIRWVLALMGGTSAALLMAVTQLVLVGGQPHKGRPLAQALQRSRGESLVEAINDHLAVPALISQINSDTLKLGTIDSATPEALEAFLGQQIRQFPTLRFIGFANEVGLLSAVQRSPQGSIQILSGQSATNGSPGRLWIYNVDSQGNRASTLRTLPTYNLDQQPWYRQPALAGQTVWTPPVRDDDGNWSISLGQPVVDRQGKRLGILSVTVALGPLGKALEEQFQSVGEGQGFVLDPATEQILLTVGGTEAERRASPRVVSPGPALKSEFPLVHAGAENLRRTFGSWSNIDRTHQISLDALGRSYELWVTPLQQGQGANWLVVSIVPAVETRGWIWSVVWVLVAGGAGAALGWGAGVWLGRSLGRLERRFRLITAGKVDTSFPVFPLEEVDELSQAAQTMIRELRARLRMGEREKTELEERVRERTTALSLSETKFSKIFYASPSGICLMRIGDGTVIDFNDSFLEIFGYSFEEMMGFTNMEFNIWQNPSDRTLVMHTLQRGSSVRNQEVAARTKSRELRMVLLSAESIYLHGTECALFVFHDITDYKRLEDDLRQSQRQLEEVERRRQWELLEGSRDKLRANLTRMENMLGSVQDSLVWTDGQGRVQWCNLAFQQLVQRDRPAILGAPLLSVLPLHQRGEPVRRGTHPVTQALKAVVGKEPYELVLGRDRRSVEISWSGVRFYEEVPEGNGAPSTEGPTEIESVSAVLTIRDISERKQLVAEVLRSKRFIDGIVENIPLAVYVKDVRQGFRHVLWNRASEALFKIARAKAIGRTGDELYFPDQAQAFRSQDREAIEARRPLEISEQPFEAVDKNGAAELLTLRTMKVPLFDAQGRILYLLSIAEDITERKDARAVLMETQAQFRLLADQAGADLMFVHDVSGNILDVNQEACRSLGFERRELLTMNVGDVDTLASLDQHDRIWSMMQPGQPVTLEGMYRCKNGRMFHVETRVGVRFSGDQRIFLAMARDVSDRKQMESALQQAEEKYRGIVENAVEGIYQCAPTGQFVSSNRALAAMFGYGAIDQVLGTTGLNRTRRFYVDPERWDSFLTLIAQTGEIYGFESQVYDADGKSFWISENARAVKDVDGRLLYYEGTMQNITERKLAEEALFAEQEKADRLLLNILPRPVAESLKQGEGTLAQMYDEATILFADLVGFTRLSAQMRPIELVNMLNLIFSTFDHLAEYHGLEKIKTVGDEYMVVGGLPLPMKDHIKAVAHLALDMQIAIQEYKSPDGQPFQIRIGINTGSVVAGVIGIKKFAYDLWGDTVNIASRMESHGEGGRIQVTETVYQALKDEFRFEERGVIDIKGRGKMATYWLLGDRSSNSGKPTSKAPIIIPGRKTKTGNEAVSTNGRYSNGDELGRNGDLDLNGLDFGEEDSVPMMDALGDLTWDEALFNDDSVIQDPTFIQDDK